MGKRAAILLGVAMVILVASLVVGSNFWPARTPAPPPSKNALITNPGEARLRELQHKADEACLCARRTGQPRDPGCWARFERALSAYEYSEASSMCMEGSSTQVCFGDIDSGICIVRERAYGACSEAEEWERRHAAQPIGDC